MLEADRPCLLWLQTIDTMMLLETPYPKDRMVVLINSTSQMVDDNLHPVPLSDVRVHACVGLRGSWLAPASLAVSSYMQASMFAVQSCARSLVSGVANASALREADAFAWLQHCRSAHGLQ